MTGRDKLTVWRPTTTTTLQLYSLELLGGYSKNGVNYIVWSQDRPNHAFILYFLGLNYI